jgi:hypothetical protein
VEAAMDTPLVVRQIVLIVFLPMAAGHLTQSLLLRRYGQERFQRRHRPGVRNRDAQPVDCPGPCHQRLRSPRGRRRVGCGFVLRRPGAVGGLICQIHGPDLRPSGADGRRNHCSA